jgi:OOP family OmpA-OmpF porin
MRKFVAHVFGVALLVGAAASVVGCTVHEVKTVTPEPKPEAKPEPPVAPKPEEKPKPAPTKMEFKQESGHLALPGPVLFETGKAVLKPESDAVLDIVRQYLEAKPDITLLRIEGFTDNVGIAADNLKLSQDRSMAVARWLIGKGIACKRLVPVGFGQENPVGDNKTPEGREANRRTYFVNAELKSKAIGGAPVDGGGKTAGNPCN